MYIRSLITLLLVSAFSMPSLALAQDDSQQRSVIRFEGNNVPRGIFPPEMLPAVRLSDEEMLTIQRARKDLMSESSERRAGAVMLLGKYEHPSARQPVVEALKDPAARVRRAALVSVAEWSRNAPVSAVIPVLNLVGDEDLDIRRTASATLPVMMTIRRTYEMIRGQGAVEPIPTQTEETLLAAFQDEDAIVRRNMVNNAYALGIHIPSKTWMALLDDPDRQVRLAALPMAARHSDSDAFLQKAAEIAQREDAAERLQLARELSLRSFDPGTLQLLKMLSEDSNDEIASEALLGLLRNQPNRTHMQEAVKRLASGRMSQEQAIQFFRIIRIAPDEAAPYLEALISLKNATLRREAVRAYLQFDLVRGKPEVLATLLEDPSPEVREQVLRYLSSGTGRLNEQLLETMLFSDYEDLRNGLIPVTRQMQPTKAGTILFDLLLDESIDVRTGALSEIVERQLPGWEKVLSASLLDSDFKLQRLALSLTLKHPYEGDREALATYLEEYPQSPLAQLVKARLGEISSTQDT